MYKYAQPTVFHQMIIYWAIMKSVPRFSSIHICSYLKSDDMNEDG